MRITMLLRCLAMMRGGGETRHLAWIRELTALGVEVDVIAGQPLAARPPHPTPDGALVRSPYLRDAAYRLQNRRGLARVAMMAMHLDDEWFCQAAWREMARRRVRPDLVHAHALYQAARLRRWDLPVVIDLQGSPPVRYLADVRGADALVADGWAADTLPGLIRRPIVRIPKGVDTELFTPEGENQRRQLNLDGKQVVVSVGPLVLVKNTAVLIDAIRIARERDPRIHLLHIGEGPELETLRRHASVIGVADAVTFAGYVPQEGLPPFYRTGQVFALTSDFDNSPNAVLEAMACGLPIVSTDVGGLREFVMAGSGELVTPRDADAIAAALLRLLSSGGEAMGRGNRRLAVDRYSWRTSAQKLLEVYERILSAREGRRVASA